MANKDDDQPRGALGTASNPIRGPEAPGFDGPQHNFSPSAAQLNAGASPLGAADNPIKGPPEGSGYGVENPGTIDPDAAALAERQGKAPDEAPEVEDSADKSTRETQHGTAKVIKKDADDKDSKDKAKAGDKK